MAGGKPGIGRREFLARIGRAAGGTAMLRSAAAMGIAGAAAACGSSGAAPPGAAPAPPRPAQPSPRPGDWPPGVGDGRSVVILGAGIAGMTAAFELQKLGYACTLLEATARAGGRNRTLRAGDVAEETDSSQSCSFDADEELYFNPGPARISHHHEFLLGYCREFGVALEAFINDNRAALLQSDAAFTGEPQVARRVMADTRGHVSALLAGAVNDGDLDQELSAADRQNLVVLLRSLGDLSGSGRYTGSDRAGFPGIESTGSRDRGDLLPVLDLQELLADAFWQERLAFGEALDQQPTMLQPVGGMDRIAQAFEARVGNDIVYEAVVTEIRKAAGAASIVYQEAGGSAVNVEADHCLCTIPASVLRDIPNDLSAEHRAAVAGFQYTPAVKLAFQARRFWEREHHIYGGISWTTQDITQLWYPNNALGSERGVLLGAYLFGGQAGLDFAGQTPQGRINTTVAQASRLHPGFTDEVSAGISVAWSKVPFQLGAWGTSDPGVLLQPDDELYFAGEHLSILQGWQEGAILSAYHAIDLIVARDSA